MKKYILLLLTIALYSAVQAQPRLLKKMMELKMPKETEDINSGTNGASVCWHPVTKKYYAAFAGNSNYPLGVFDAEGKLLSDSGLTTMQDVRGLWYDKTNKKFVATYIMVAAGFLTHSTAREYQLL